MLAEEVLQRSASRFRDKTALVSEGRRYTYGELDSQSSRFAHALVAKGVTRGSTAAFYLENSVEAVISIFAILKAGASFLPIEPSAKSGRVARLLNDSRAVALVTNGRHWALAKAACRDSPALASVFVAGPLPDALVEARTAVFGFEGEIAAQPSALAPAKSCIDMDMAALMYTSGSTGIPKGVMWSHLNIVSSTASITSYLQNTPQDVILNVLPLSLSYGLTQMFTAFSVGATLVLERSFAFPGVILQRLVEEKITGFAMVPAVACLLLQMDLQHADLSSLRYLTNAAAPISTKHIHSLRQRLPNTQIYSMHGLTECIRTTFLPPDQIDIRPSSVGKGMPNTELYLVDENGERLKLGSTGELVVRGSNVMKGYWRMPEETDRVLKPGPLPGERVLHTGDLFRTDEEGFLYFISRKDEIIKSRGQKISPKEVEDVLYSMPEVIEAAVVGVPDEMLGNAILAVLVLLPGVELTRQDVLRHCAEHLEQLKIPKYVKFMKELPRTPGGKTSKRELGKLIEDVV